MLDPESIPSVEPDEMLARFILYSGHFKTSDNSIRPDAFIPYSLTELSITRHIQTTEVELLKVGDQVALDRIKPLYGRADVQTSAFLEQELPVIPDPIPASPTHPGNPNHANAIGWPAEKSAQKMKAIEIAIRATLVRYSVN